MKTIIYLFDRNFGIILSYILLFTLFLLVTIVCKTIFSDSSKIFKTTPDICMIKFKTLRQMKIGNTTELDALKSYPQKNPGAIQGYKLIKTQYERE